MSRTAPYFTLGAVAVLGVGLFLANGVAAPAGPGGAAPVVVAAPAGEPRSDPAAPPPAVPAPAAPGAAPPAAPGAAPPAAPGAAPPAPPPAAAPPAAAPDAAVPPAAGDVVYAGRTDDRVMTVAIAVQGAEATAYVCGAGLEIWLRGTVSAEGRLDLVSASGLTTLTGKGEAGTVEIEGVSRDYTAQVVADPPASDRDDVRRLLERIGRA